MISEALQVNISAKILDFEKKMAVVEKKIATVQKGSSVASKTIDKLLSTKKAGTHKAIDMIEKKLKQVDRSAAKTRKALSEKMMLSTDGSGLDLQKAKLDQLKQKYDDLMSGAKAPASLKTAERNLAAIAKELAVADARAATLYAELQKLQGLQSAAQEVGNVRGVARYQTQIDAVQREMDALAASTDAAGAKADSFNAKIQALRMNPSASSEARVLAAQIRQADAKMQKLGTDTTTTTKKISGMRSGSGALDVINRKISSLERSSARTAKSVSALGRRFLVLFTGKLISAAFNGIQDSLEGAATKSDDLKDSLNTLSSSGRTITNTVVAALAPLINTAAPMIDYITTKIMEFGNSLAMAFAFITGQTTVLQAVKAYDEYGDAAETAGEKAKKALAGFDQITTLDTSSSSGSGGGSSDSGTTSFVTAPVVGSGLALKIKDAIDRLSGPLQTFYETVLKPIGEWVMTEGIDLLASALINIADFVAENPGLTVALLGTAAAIMAIYNALRFIGTVSAAITALKGLGGAGAGSGGAGGAGAAGTVAAVSLGLLAAELIAVGALTAADNERTTAVWRGMAALKKANEYSEVAVGWETREKQKLDDLTTAHEKYARRMREATNLASILAGKNTRLFDKTTPLVNLFKMKLPDAFKQAIDNSPASTFSFLADKIVGVGESSTEAERLFRLNTTAMSTNTATQTGAIQTSLTTLGGIVTTQSQSIAHTLASNTNRGINASTESYRGYPSTVEAYLAQLSTNVNTESNKAGGFLFENTKRSVNDTIPHLANFTNDATTKLTRFSNNARLAMLDVLTNLGKLPSTASPQSIFLAKDTLMGSTLPKLPMFATGGVVDKATNAIIGESGKEAVMPLERNTGWMDKLGDRIASRVQGGGGEQTVITNVYLDSGVLVDHIVKKINRNSRRANRSILA